MTLSDTARARLSKLADLLDAHPPEQFNMGSWACGTTCCAAALAARKMPECGLAIVKCSCGDSDCNLLNLYSESGGCYNFDACAVAFDLPSGRLEAAWLFVSYYSGRDCAPRQQAARIRWFLAHDGTECPPRGREMRVD